MTPYAGCSRGKKQKPFVVRVFWAGSLPAHYFLGGVMPSVKI
jgi:hypothetical protein